MKWLWGRVRESYETSVETEAKEGAIQRICVKSYDPDVAWELWLMAYEELKKGTKK